MHKSAFQALMIIFFTVGVAIIIGLIAYSENMVWYYLGSIFAGGSIHFVIKKILG